MLQNRIDATVTAADVQAALAAVALIKDKVPFLIDLTTHQRRALPKLGDGSRAFVQKALEIAKQNEDILPRSFDVATMERDLELFFDLMPILTAVARLHELLDDTLTQIGSEVMTAALLVYRQVQHADGMETEQRELKARFEQNAGGANTPPNPA